MKYYFSFILSLFCCHLSIAQVDLNLGLLAYYPFNGNANDASGNNLNATTFNAVQLTSDRFGAANKAYHFDGIDDYMKVADNGVLSTPSFSICYYFNTESNTYQNCIGKIGYTTGNGATYNSGIFQPGSIPYFATISNASGCNVQVPGTLVYTMYNGVIQPNEWHCIVNTFDNGVQKLYIDGVMAQNNTPFTQAKYCTNTDFVIGSWWQGDPYRFRGKMDEIRFYNRAISQDEVNALCVLESCNNWLTTPSANSFFRVGDLDVTGNQVTVEANINRTQPYLSGTGNDTEGDVVAKHIDASNANYILRPNHAYISTSNGFFATPDVCDLELNKTYHVAMVYDGATLKFYRDGFLMSQVNATGNLIQSDINTQIGHYDAGFWNTQFLGYTNEVRIWNVARTQAQLQTYMNASLPNPTTQPGLLAYYTFDNLLNKQGNAAWNGSLFNGASINNTNANCSFTADSCNVVAPPANISNIINDYTPVLALNPCNNSITVEDGTAFNAGDTVLIIQMKGAEIDVSNTATFGTLTNYHNSGNYEFNIVKAKTGNIIELKNKLTRPYDIPLGKVQLIRVPYYNSVNVSATLTCLPWDGNKGGVLVLHARDTVNLLADLDVNGRGFAGGLGFNSNNPVLTCFQNNYTYPAASAVQAALKGESIATLANSIVRGKGAPAAGGGGGLGHNSAGGGGGNAGAGGFGGYQLDNCGSFPFDNRGIGGHPLTYNTVTNKIFLGSGGGAGNQDNPGNPPTSGGNGAGIIIVIADYLKTNSNLITANGDDGFACICHDGMGGGGGGGAVLLDVNQYLDNATVEKKGGNGADMVEAVNVGGRIGPGGGGGGGMLFIKNPTLPAAVNSINTAGVNGVLTQAANNPYGATPGTDGLNLFNLVVPVDTVLFKPNIDSVRIKDSITSCFGYNFNGLGYTNTTGIVDWHWDFGDTNTANTQNTSHNYTTTGTYDVELVVTDINGCKDSITKTVSIVPCNNAISGIINDYTPVIALDPCNNSLTVENATEFNAGDTVLLIQMKGAVIDSANTTSFGTVTNYRNAGNYEFNYVLSKTGNIIKLKNKLTKQYDLPGGRVQLIRVPYYTSTDVSANLTCLPWDGTKGGVLAFNVRDTLTLNADIDVSNKGFRGGAAGNSFLCGVADYASSNGTTGSKGEGIAELNAPWNAGGGHLANGGGGSFGGNSGAGGGSNLVAGGVGGREYSSCPGLQSMPGQALTNNLNTKVYMGGGGGGGQFDNGFIVYPGGNGGGMVFISSNHVKGNSFNINANGFSRSEVINDEGGAAGGAGGSVILVANNLINTINVNATGGSGNSNNNTTFPTDCHGPGAGGSGGVVFVKQGTVPVNLAVNLTGGNAGLVLNPVSACFNTTHGATNGANGSPLINFVMNIDTSLFVPNIDSVRIQENATSCTGFDFHGLGYTNTTAIVQWNWNFGDGNFGTGQDVSHNYLGTGPYDVVLVGTDINGCKDSMTIPVTLNSLVVNAGNDTAFCSNGVVTHVLHGNTTGLGYTWIPGGFLDNSTSQNPTATISSTTMFYLNTTGSGGCAAIDSVLITVNPLPALATINDFSICKLDSMLLTTVSTATAFQWTPPLSVNNPSVASPYFTDTVSQQLIITGTNAATGCFTKDTINVTVKPLPNVLAVPDTSLCGPHPVTLTATGAQTYSWSPATGLNNPGIANPVFNGTATQTYIITGAGANACVAKDTITITVNAQPVISTIVNNAICRGDSIQLLTNTDAETIQWTPAIAVSDPTIANPWFHDTLTHQMIVTGTNATGCFVKDTVTITVKPLPNVLSIPDTAICGPQNVTLNTTGGQTYSWLPATDLSNPNIGSPVFTGTNTQTYTVTGTGANACSAKDTVTITVKYSAGGKCYKSVYHLQE